jgi:hypothetical protein
MEPPSVVVPATFSTISPAPEKYMLSPRPDEP